ncbi:MAG: FecR domain-containing protein [Devosia sp.]
MKQFVLIPLLGLCLSLAAPAAYADGEGTAVGVNPDAVARVSSSDRLLHVGADVSVGEMIVTGPSGQVQIIFDDATRLVVGPRSSLLIETYLLASSNTAQKLTINALGGSFRFITGNSPKPAYSINTPTAAIAVRGTEFDLIVEPRITRVMLYDGALLICNNSGDCEVLDDRCEVGSAAGQQTVLYQRLNPERAPLSAQFRYARFQGSLLPPFRVNGVGNCVEERAEADPGSGSSPTPQNQTQTQTQTQQQPGRN